ncbi:hypothetical protein Poli38472_011619 [Pythium oligandrum]|uniref:DNA polymerase n=1 Tax=Pythium oligandrum TaxID=41045 RepID=A0A8K1FL04_PYTOL|nr:hypothetical protein Poli38472_011619 [Pythium oligandrum]|eukprot:TMW64739.1 hypothetical protein Poli38472_011619 [Pythium oligandrum]
MSSRRGTSARSGNSNRKSALDEIRRLRDGGGLQAEAANSRIAQYKPQEEGVFKTVTEEEYEEIVQQRRTALPFVENDDTALGYYDDGEEQFFESDTEADGRAREEDEEEGGAGKKRSAGALSSSYARRAKKMQRAKLADNGAQKITNMFFSATSGQKPGGAAPGGARKPLRGNAKRDIDLDSMLDDLTSNPTETRQTYARPVSYSSGSSYSNGASSQPRSSLGGSGSARVPRVRELVEEDEDADGADDNYGDNSFEQDVEADVSMEEVNDATQEEEQVEQEPAEKVEPMVDEEEAPAEKTLSKRELLLRKAREAQLKTTAPTARALAAVTAPEPEPATNTKSHINKDVVLADVPSNEVAEWWQAGGNGGNTQADADMAEADAEPEFAPTADSIQMFWMDAVEVRDRPGKIYLIGKIKTLSENSNTPTYKSCCVVVNNVERYMYLVPRLSEDKDGSSVLKDLPKPKQQEHWMAMHEEIRKILIPSCISVRRDQEVFQTKLVERDYAFELADMPRGKNLYLKVKYPARYPVPPSDICSRGGQTFTRIAGAFTRPLENFLLRRKLLGPGWIEIKNVRKSTESPSFCSVEYETFNPKDVSAIQGLGLQPPPLTVMSLSLKTFCNPTTGKHEVVALSSITESGVSSDGGRNNAEKRISHFTAIRPLESNVGFPGAYTEAAKSDPRFASAGNDCLHVEFNERAMLSYFLSRVQREDPDVIVGHNLHKYALDLLISRIDHYHLGGLWSKITRLRRGRLTPMNVGEGWNEYRMDDTVNGRLFCDTYVSAKELLPSQNNYSLSYLVQSQLKKQRTEVEMNDIPQILHGGPQNFVRFLRHTLDDAMFVLQLMHKLEVLPLSKQLANLCGYLWTKTLEANKRAERIEYLLLHEFSRSKRKFIVPEKFGNKKGDNEKSGRRREKASYAGGMVFAPKKGLYDNFVVLLDFNSLYPSIIREYNICFTTVERKLQDDNEVAPKSSKSKKKKKTATPAPNAQVEDGGEDDDLIDDQDAPENADDSEIPPLPSSACDEGILPTVVKRLLESRKQVKQQLKAETIAGNVEKANRLDIRQKAIKLTANSMYGCLGFRYSRFHAKPIAALITSTGRQTLQRAKEVAEQECGYDVIYGDTDSIMVDSRSDKLDDAKRIGREIQVQCNKHFKLLELEVDYIFKAILLLNKKKYAALVVKERGKGDVAVEKEVKGLDMVRRDWCVISKTIGMEILDFILSGNSRDDVVESIHEHLEQVADRIRSGKEPIEQFVITKSLNKQPEQYPDRAKQYHVQVALALKAQGQPIGIGSHVPYVLCKEEEPGSGRRAYHPDEVKRSGDKLTIDVEWYLESQIHPPVNRLCAHIEGTSSPQLAHCLGLDTAKFSHSANHFGDEQDGNDAIPSVLQNDSDRFKACTPLELTCSMCKQTNPFPGVYHNTDHGGRSHWTNGMVCVNPACKAEFWGFDKEGIYGNIGDDLQAVLSNRLHSATREAIKKYYEAWVVCSDVTCKTRTQKQSLRGNGNICSAPGCRALVRLEFPDNALYTQLKFFASLFDVDRAQKKAQEQSGSAANSLQASKVDLPILSERHRAILKALHDQAQHSVRQNDYNWVKPSIWQTLFT